jgi:ribonuclease D
VWEAVAHVFRARGERYVVVNPLTTFRVREARQLSREKTDVTDAEQIAEVGRTGLVTRTQLEAGRTSPCDARGASITGFVKSGRG